MKELKKQHLEMLQLLESIEVMFQNGNSIHPNSIIRGAIQKLIGMEVDVTNVNDKCDNKHTAVEWLIRDVNENIAPLYIPKQVIEQAKAIEKEQKIAFGKKCFYKGFEKAENDDANCFTAWREEANELLTYKSE